MYCMTDLWLSDQKDVLNGGLYGYQRDKICMTDLWLSDQKDVLNGGLYGYQRDKICEMHDCSFNEQPTSMEGHFLHKMCKK